MEWLIPSRHFSKGSVPLVSSSDCWRPQPGSGEPRWNGRWGEGETQQHHCSIDVTLFKSCLCYSKCSAARCSVRSGPPHSDQNSTAANEGPNLGFMSCACVFVFAALHPHAWPFRRVLFRFCRKQMLSTKRRGLQLHHLEVERGLVGSDPETACDWLLTKTDWTVKNKTARLLCNA